MALRDIKSNMAFSRVTSFLLIMFVVGSLTGCSQGDRPPIGLVTGKITMDGEPLVGTIVSFMPDSGRPATGLTDKEGKYQIQYAMGVYGTKIGNNTICLFPGSSGGTSHEIAAKYQNPQTSDLKAEVKKGNNTFDFELESDAATKARNLKKKNAPPVLD